MSFREIISYEQEEVRKEMQPKIDAEKARADRAESRADKAESRADKAESRADKAESEILKLRKLLQLNGVSIA